MNIEEICAAASVIPVIELPNVEAGPALAEALADGGLKVIELTLRTPAGLAALGPMKAARPDLVIGMGTALNADDAKRAVDGGADFLVTPGTPPALLAAIIALNTPALPGVATISEAMALRDAGLTHMKFFPAVPAGGLSYLKAIAGPLPELSFCPTGGVSAEAAPDFLALPNVACVGGSWICPKKLIVEEAWDGIRANARRAAAMKSPAG